MLKPRLVWNVRRVNIQIQALHHVASAQLANILLRANNHVAFAYQDFFQQKEPNFVPPAQKELIHNQLEGVLLVSVQNVLEVITQRKGQPHV